MLLLALARFDNLLRSAVADLTNPQLTDTQWVQISLPIRDGGLGLRQMSSLAGITRLLGIRRYSNLSLQETILSRSHCIQQDTFLASRKFLDQDSSYDHGVLTVG